MVCLQNHPPSSVRGRGAHPKGRNGARNERSGGAAQRLDATVGAEPPCAFRPTTSAAGAPAAHVWILEHTIYHRRDSGGQIFQCAMVSELEAIGALTFGTYAVAQLGFR
jgi:hypothetical protein